MGSFGGCVNLEHFKKTKTASRVNDMRSSKDGQNLHTNVGTISFQDLLNENKNGMFWSDDLQELWVDDQWISKLSLIPRNKEAHALIQSPGM
ncbi:hypothetical protein VI817_001370 [Penicillium citrinum]|uniref:Uncharacterized protein n=1 Tax=Penicillium hetheringtonii TaxID=911720 RepID=A0AAD6H0A0_9EURO|nr:hypothetical protein N7450_001369 [Penicillium hetheringtonii]KAK5807112.1 hypothetical protein VI817_001370 [Penicillium citrinum]